jgi:hypothetical protein
MVTVILDPTVLGAGLMAQHGKEDNKPEVKI